MAGKNRSNGLWQWYSKSVGGRYRLLLGQSTHVFEKDNKKIKKCIGFFSF
jgi:hypothetical protein